MLDVAARVDDLESPPGNRLKVLKGAMKGRHSIRVADFVVLDSAPHQSASTRRIARAPQRRPSKREGGLKA
jgi:hypothetical protein